MDSHDQFPTLSPPRPRVNRRLSLAWALALSVGFPRVGFPRGTADASLKRFEYSLPRMGTIFRVEMYAADGAHASKAAEAAYARAEELEQIMSDYRPDSELNTLAREGCKAPFPVSQDLYDVLTRAMWISHESGGMFDVSIGPVVRLWRAARKSGQRPGRRGHRQSPGAGELPQHCDGSAKSHRVPEAPGMILDLGGVGKGYAADQMLATLEAQGIHRAMVVAGGEVVVGDPPPGKFGWNVTLDTAASAESAVSCSVLLNRGAVSTSGDEHQFFVTNGHRYSHVINPKTGWALEGQSSTTIVTRNFHSPDGLCTALSLMPVADGIRVAESIPGVAVLMVRRVNGEWKSYTSHGFPTTCRILQKGGK